MIVLVTEYSVLSTATRHTPHVISGFLYSCLGSIPQGATGLVVDFLIYMMKGTDRIKWHTRLHQMLSGKYMYFM